MAPAGIFVTIVVSLLLAQAQAQDDKFCLSNNDCDSDRLCNQSKCINPCLLNLCGDNSDCTVNNHIPVCACKPGFSGPLAGCSRDEFCLSNQDCASDRLCAESKCINPCLLNLCGDNSNCTVTNHSPVCTCMSGFTGSPAGCSDDNFCLSNKDCASDRLCAESKCINPCLLNLCGHNSNCTVTDHIPVCTCKPGFYGTLAGCSHNGSGKKKFKLHTNHLDWHRANIYCLSQNMILATIDSQEEQDSLERQIKDSNVDDDWWIGGADHGNTGDYLWEVNGRRFTYTNFAPGEPDNFVTRLSERTMDDENDDDHCLELRRWIYDWRDERCVCRAQNFICEYYD